MNAWPEVEGRAIAAAGDRWPGRMSQSVAEPSGGAQFPRGGSQIGRKVLVVSTVEEPLPSLRSRVRAADEIRVIVPVVRQGILDWLANDERAFSQAEEVAKRTAYALGGEAADSSAGEADVELAIHDALAMFPADEVIVVMAKGNDDLMRPDTQSRGNIDGVPISLVIVNG